jgi:hypothetical protein
MKKILPVAAIMTLFAMTAACSRGPEPPQLIYPQDGAILLNLPFSWSSVPEAENYFLEIATDQLFASVILDKTLTDTTYEIQNPEIFQTGITIYYWHVYSGDGNRWGQASETWMFTLTTGGKSWGSL